MTWLDEELAALDERGLRRRMRPVSGPQRAEVIVDGRPAINFSSNNYLGLADHPALIDAATSAMREDGFGAGASRLIVGNLGAHRALELRLAEWLHCPATLLFNTGYHANIGAITALVGREDVVYSDALNHASLIDGARLSRAEVEVYHHVDLDDLRARLAGGRRYRRRLIVTDSIFSMDGDEAPLAGLLALARAHDALLLVDEAHALGVLGDGRGCAADLDVDLRMATLGKALGGFGAFIAASQQIIDLLIQRSRSFIFTTGLPVPVAAAARAAVDLVAGQDGQARRARLDAAVARFHAGLRALAFPSLLARPSHIVPLLVGDPARTMALSDQLLARGIFAQGIRPPTVPQGTSRLRFSLMATHTDAHVDAALAALAALRDQFPRS